jgi:uncharacterized membrane protein
MLEIPLQLLAIGATMIGLDAVWLTLNAATNRTVFAAIQTKPLEVRWIPAILVYVIMIGATWFFAVWKTTSWKVAAAKGAALGLSLYGLYDLTNYATLIKYPLDYAVRDIAWGTFLIGTSALVASVVAPFYLTTQIEQKGGAALTQSRF